MTENIEVSKPIMVEFYPSFDDNVYVATKIHNTAPSTAAYKYATYIFTLVNLISFPAFLFFTGYVISGISVFIVNLVIVAIYLPSLLKSSLKDFYKKTNPHLETRIAIVELSDEGLRYRQDDAETIFAWTRFTHIEENDDSIFFFYDGNGFGIRKSGFAYKERERDFVTIARSNISSARREIVK